MTTDGTNPPQTPAGWYPDTTVPGTQRYWDGTAWTQHTAPLAGATPIASAPTPVQPHPAVSTPQPAEPLAYPAVGSLNAAVPVNAPEKKSKAGLIVGLIVGGIALLVVLAVIAAFATRGDSDPGGAPTNDASASQTPSATPSEDATDAPVDAAAVDVVVGETAWGVDSSDLTWFAVIVPEPNVAMSDFAEVLRSPSVPVEGDRYPRGVLPAARGSYPQLPLRRLHVSTTFGGWGWTRLSVLNPACAKRFGAAGLIPCATATW